MNTSTVRPARLITCVIFLFLLSPAAFGWLGYTRLVESGFPQAAPYSNGKSGEIGAWINWGGLNGTAQTRDDANGWYATQMFQVQNVTSQRIRWRNAVYVNPEGRWYDEGESSLEPGQTIWLAGDTYSPWGDSYANERAIYDVRYEDISVTVNVVVGGGSGSAWGGGTVSSGNAVTVYANSSGGHWVFLNWATSSGLGDTTGQGTTSSTWSFNPGSSQTAYAYFQYKNTPPFGSLDWATGALTQGDTLSSGGWAADAEQGAASSVQLAIDGSPVGSTGMGGQRDDVAGAFSRDDYRYSGWGFSCGTSGLSEGWHTISATAYDDNNVSTNIGSKSFYVYPRTYTLSTSSSPGGWVDGGGSYSAGRWAGVTAYANYGYYFAGFSNAAWGTDNPAYVYMDGDKSVYAQFYPNTYQVYGSVNGSGSISGTGGYSYGSSTYLTAYPGTGYYFTGWSGTLGGTGNGQWLYVDGDKSVTANFVPYSYTVVTQASGSGSVTGGGIYTYGGTAYLTAIPATGYYFTGWSDGGAQSHSLWIDHDQTLTAYFAPIVYTISTAVNGSGSLSGGGSYSYGQTATITATPSTGWYFTGFSGDASGSTNPQSFTVTGGASITANFARLRYTVSTATMPAGIGYISGAADYNYGEVATITAPDLSPAYNFTGFSGAVTGASNPQSFTVAGNASVTAYYTTASYAINTTVSGTGSGTVSGAGTYNYGAAATLTASPATGSTFSSWTGGLTGNTNPRTITVNGSLTANAVFTLNNYVLNTSNNGTGSGSVTPSGSYPYGTVKTITATAATGSTFTGWSGAASGSTNPINITVDSDKAVQAHFGINTYTVSTETVPAGLGTVTGAGTYTYGQTPTITAPVVPGYTFTGFAGDLYGTTNPQTLTVNGNKGVAATYTRTNYNLITNTSGVGSGTVTAGGTYPSGTTKVITATPATGSSFTGWAYAATGTTNPVTITIDADKTLTGYFVLNYYPVTYTAIGNGGISGLDSYQHGSTATWTAYPAAHNHLVGWSGDVFGTTTTINMVITSAKQVTATFAPDTYTVTAAPYHSDFPAITGTGTFNYGQTATLTAPAVTGYSFTGWSGSVTSTANPLSVVVDADKNLTATYAPNSYTVTVATSPSGLGTVTGGGSYLYGQNATVTAPAATGYTFTGWTGSLTSSSNPATLSVDANKSVTANYSTNSYSLAISVIGSGTATGAGTYNYGQTATLGASPATGWLFSGFSGAVSSSISPSSLVIDGNKAVTATFLRQTYTLATSTSGAGAVTPGGTYNAPDPSVTAVTIIATPAASTRYFGFTGSTSGTTASDNGDGTGSLYVPMTMNRTIVANFASKLPQSISFAAIGAHSVNETFVELSATASSGLPVSFVLVSGPAMLSGSRLTFTGVGAVVVIANQAGNYMYFAAPPVQQNASVVAAPVTSLKEDEGESKISDGEKEEGNFHPRL